MRKIARFPRADDVRPEVIKADAIRQPHAGVPGYTPPGYNITNCRRVEREIALGAYGKVLSAGKEDGLVVGTLASVQKGLAKQFGNHTPCRLCGRGPTNGNRVCVRCSIDYADVLRFLS